MAYTKVRSSHTGKEVVERSQKIRAEFANDAAVFAENPEFLGKFNIAMDSSQVETWNEQFGAAMDSIPNNLKNTRQRIMKKKVFSVKTNISSNCSTNWG